MIACGNCKRRLTVARTVQAGNGAQTQEMKCSHCGARYTSATFVVQKIEGRGTGPEALAARLNNPASEPAKEAARRLLREAPGLP